MMGYGKLWWACLGLTALVGCSDTGPGVPAGEESKHLFSLKSAESVGDQTGGIALNDRGIFLHPGQQTPTTVSFNLDGKYRSIGLKPYIAPLDDAGKGDPAAGVVGVEVLVDGKSVDKFQVDRNFNLEKNFELKGARLLEVRVDNGNGTPAWDWFHLKVVSIK